MKCLTIKQPWASLIIYGYKKYEFRSWKTNYRGKIFIHAGIGIEKNILNKYNNYDLNYVKGAIIGEAEIVDCIKVTDKFIGELLKDNNVVYGNGNYIESYAWQLDNIVKYDNPIYIKGKLGLWNYELSELENRLLLIMDKMKDIKYGFVDNYINIYIDDDKNWDNNFSKKYYLQDPLLLSKTKYGVCWDQVELERFYLEKNNIDFFSYFIINYDNKIFPTHTFIIATNNNEFVWIEHSWEKYRGIHKFDSLDNALLDIKLKFNYMIKEKYNINNGNTVIYRYEKPKYGIGCLEFINHCENGINIDI